MFMGSAAIHPINLQVVAKRPTLLERHDKELRKEVAKRKVVPTMVTTVLGERSQGLRGATWE